MQRTSDVYKDLLLRGATKEVRVEIGGEIYGEDRLVEMSTSGSLFSAETLCVGSAVSGQIDLTVIDYGAIPRMAKIVPSYRLVLGNEVSEWIQKGVYYIDTRQPDKASGTLKIHGFDAMLKGSVIWEPDHSLVFPMTRRVAASVIASLMGVELDNPEDIDNTQAIVDYPANDYTQRNILQFIAASHAANFVMTDSGKLRMVTINDIPAETGFLVNEAGKSILIGGIRILVSDTLANKVTGEGSKVFVGQNVESTGAAPSLAPISKIIVKVDEENAWVSGNDGGTVLEVSCPYGSQAMANELLAKVGGFVYQPFTADGALVDNAIELGDGITVDGVYTMLAKQEIVFDGLMAGSVSAPGEYEVESEYPYQTREQQIEYKLASTRSLISKTSEEIRLEVTNEIEGLSAAIELDMTQIVGRVEDTEQGLSQTVRLAADGLTITNANGSKLTIDGGQLRANSIETAAFKAKSITADKLNITGAITFGDLDEETQIAISDAYTMAMENQLPSYIQSTYIDEVSIQSPTIVGGTFIGNEFNVLSESSGGSFNLYGKYYNSYVHALEISYSAGDAPVVYFDGAIARFEFDAMYCHCNIDMGSYDITFNPGTGITSLRDLEARVTALEKK